MRFVILVLALALAVCYGDAASAVRFVGYNTTSCPVSGGAVRFNVTAEPQKCFSFINLASATDACTLFYVLQTASNTPVFDVYGDNQCIGYRDTKTFDSLCQTSIEGVTESCSGANTFQLEIVPGQECTTNCIAPVSSDARTPLPLSIVTLVMAVFTVAAMYL